MLAFNKNKEYLNSPVVNTFKIKTWTHVIINSTSPGKYDVILDG